MDSTPYAEAVQQDGDWIIRSENDNNWFWEWELDVPDSDALAVGDAQIAALKADVRARRQVCRRTHGAQFSETLGIVALAEAARGQ